MRGTRQVGVRVLSYVPNPVGENRLRVVKKVLADGLPAYLKFDEEEFCRQIEECTESMCYEFPQFRYADSVEFPTLYSSIYACLIYSLTGKLNRMSQIEKDKWLRFFDDHQDPDTGYWFDKNADPPTYTDTDWWGARHLVLHAIPAYLALGGKPKYRLSFLNEFYNLDVLQDWLDKIAWERPVAKNDDIDNQIMNIVCAMQFERDEYNDDRAARAVDFVHAYLTRKCSPVTGLWGGGIVNSPDQLSRSIQFTYHLLSSFYYDSVQVPLERTRLIHAIASQNVFGGFGRAANSSACEDIDSLDIICRHRGDEEFGGQIELVLQKAQLWILANQNEDGGFVFRMNEPLQYGHVNLSSAANESALFPTWFRLLSVALISNSAGRGSCFYIERAPGYYSH